jgi:small multidrug resistance pump
MSWIYLLLAIAFEVVGTTSLKASDGFSKLLPSIGVIVGYGFAFALMSLSVKSIPLGTAYAVWSGVGTVGALVAGIFIFEEKTNAWQLAGVALILIGTVILKSSHSS